MMLAGMAPAMAGEPLRLDDATLDIVTAGATSLAGFEIGLNPGSGPFVVNTVSQGVSNGSFALQGAAQDDTGIAAADLTGVVTTETTPYSSVSIARIGGATQTLGTGTASVDPAMTASGQNIGFGSVIIPIPGENGITEYVGASWAWAIDVPTVAVIP
ncbi:MAG: hypothetical protein R3D25_16910 [Geminicoccaceae bacterium]